MGQRAGKLRDMLVKLDPAALTAEAIAAAVRRNPDHGYQQALLDMAEQRQRELDRSREIDHELTRERMRGEVEIDGGWAQLPGWPARCPGSGGLGRAWTRIANIDDVLNVVWEYADVGAPAMATPIPFRHIDAVDLLKLVRHPSVRGEAKTAMAAAWLAAKREDESAGVLGQS